MGEFSYLPYVIVVVFVGYVLLTALILQLTKKTPRTNFIGIPDGKSFYVATHGCCGITSSTTLAITRIVSAVFFWIFFVLLLTISYYKRIWVFFTNWNVLLLMAYYSIAATASIIKLCGVDGKYEWLGNVIAIVFTIVTPTAFFVTCVDFILLNHEVTYWNFSGHLITSVTVLMEVTQNSIRVTWRNMPITYAWALLYLSFIWPVRANNVAKRWPYDFLDTSSPTCFLWYPGLFLMITLFFAVFKALVELKFMCARKYFPEYHSEKESDEDCLMSGGGKRRDTSRTLLLSSGEDENYC
jgi:hypothetical protein